MASSSGVDPSQLGSNWQIREVALDSVTLEQVVQRLATENIVYVPAGKLTALPSHTFCGLEEVTQRTRDRIPCQLKWQKRLGVASLLSLFVTAAVIMRVKPTLPNKILISIPSIILGSTTAGLGFAYLGRSTVERDKQRLNQAITEFYQTVEEEFNSRDFNHVELSAPDFAIYCEKLDRFNSEAGRLWQLPSNVRDCLSADPSLLQREARDPGEADTTQYHWHYKVVDRDNLPCFTRILNELAQPTPLDDGTAAFVIYYPQDWIPLQKEADRLKGQQCYLVALTAALLVISPPTFLKGQLLAKQYNFVSRLANGIMALGLGGVVTSVMVGGVALHQRSLIGFLTRQAQHERDNIGPKVTELYKYWGKECAEVEILIDQPTLQACIDHAAAFNQSNEKGWRIPQEFIDACQQRLI